jgi:hypothetical protein
VGACSLGNTGLNLNIDTSSFCNADTVTFSAGTAIATAQGRLTLNAPTSTAINPNGQALVLVNDSGHLDLLTPTFDSGVVPGSATQPAVLLDTAATARIVNGTIGTATHGYYYGVQCLGDSKASITGVGILNSTNDGIQIVSASASITSCTSSTANARYGINVVSGDWYDGGGNTISGSTAQFGYSAGGARRYATGFYQSGHVSTTGGIPATSGLIAGITSATVATGSTDDAGKITLVTTGSPPAVGATLFTVTYATAYTGSNVPIVVVGVGAQNSGGAGVLFGVGASALGTFTVVNEGALAAGTTYVIYYIVRGQI